MATDIPLAQVVCERHPGPFSNIIQLGLRYRNLDQAELKELLADQGRQEVSTLERGLGILETIAGIGPLIGLLGTVLGMIRVFTVISDQGVGQSAALAGGISEALVTTVAGLSLGIPALVMYNYFTSRADRLILDMEKYTMLLLMKLHHMGQESARRQDGETLAPVLEADPTGE